MIHQTVENEGIYRGYPVNTGSNNQYAYYPAVMDKIIDRQEWMTQNHSKVLFVRFDLRFPRDYQGDGGNTELSHFWKIISERGDYHSIDFQYVWVREQSQEKHQHYHCLVYLNGNRVQNGFAYLSVIEDAWGTALGVDDPRGLVHFCGTDEGEYGIMLRRPSRFADDDKHQAQQEVFEQAGADCINRGSYLAKENQKVSAPKGVRSFGASIMR